MNKATIAVLVVAAGLLGFLALKQRKVEKKAEKAQQEAATVVIPGWIEDKKLQAAWSRRETDRLGFLKEEEKQRRFKFGDPPYDEIELVRKGVSMTLRRRVGPPTKKSPTKPEELPELDPWEITSPIAADVKEHHHKNMMRQFAVDMTLTAVGKVTDPKQLRRYWLDEGQAIGVTLKKGGKALISLKIGYSQKIRTGPDQQDTGRADTFVMRSDTPDMVYRARSKNLRQPFDVDLSNMRVSQVFAFHYSDIERITIMNPADKVAPKIVLAATWTELAKKPAPGKQKAGEKPDMKGTWQMVEPKRPDYALSDLGGYAKGLAKFGAMKFVMGEKPTAEMGLAGDDVPRIIIDLKSGEPKQLILRLGADKEKGKSIYAQVEGRDEYMIVSSSRRKSLFKSLAGFRDKLVLGIKKPADVTRVSLSNQKTKVKGTDVPVVVERKAGKLVMTQPNRPFADEQKLRSLASGLRFLQAVDFLPAAPDPKDSGLGDPTGTLTVTAGGVEKTLVVGAERDSKFTCRLAGKDVYFTVSSSSINSKVLLDEAYFRSKKVVAVDPADIKKVELKHEKETVVLERVDKESWRMTSPEQLTGKNGLKDAKVQKLVRALSSFGITTFSEAAPGVTGLASPAFTAVVHLANGSTRELRVSSKRVDSNYYLGVVGPRVPPTEAFLVSDPLVKTIRKKAADLK